MSIKQLDDQQLIASYIQGNHQAFEVLLMRHKNSIYRAIYLKVKDRDLTEDLFQDTFIKIIKTFKKGNYNEEGKFLPWALRIANNLIIDYFRKQNRVKFIQEKPSANQEFNIFQVIACPDDHILSQLSKEELLQQMVELVEHLPDAQREMIRMRIFEDQSFKDIAENENISINTALGRMRYALINLRKLIEKHELVVDVA
jgi:RNA polymerase sigma-70 factor (ECF subfamily)